MPSPNASWEDGVASDPSSSDQASNASWEDGIPADPTFAQKALDLAKSVGSVAGEAAWGGVKKTGSDIYHSIADGIPAAINFLKGSADKAPDLQNKFGIPEAARAPEGSLAWAGIQALEAVGGMGEEVGSKLKEMSPNERKATLTRIGTTAILTLAAGPEAGVFRQAIFSSAGDLLGGEISQKAGFEKDTPLFTKEEITKKGSNFVESLLLPKLMGIAGKGSSKLGQVTEDASVPIAAKEAAIKGKAGYLAGRMTLGKNTGNEMALVDQLKEGEKTFAKVVVDEFPDKIQDAGELRTALDNSIATRVAEKKGLMEDLNDALSSPASKSSKPFSRNQVGYQDVTQTIRKLKATGIGTSVVPDLEELQRDLTNAFSLPKKQGLPGIVANPKNFQGMSDLLDQVYDRMRGLKAFDPTNAVKASEVSANKQAIDAYGTVADKIKKSMASQARTLEAQGLVPSGTAKRLEDLNQEIHELIPYKEAAKRFDYSEYQTLKQPQPAGTLIQQPGSPFSGGGSLRSKMLDVVSSPVTEYPVKRARLNETLGFAPDTLSDMKQSSDLLLGRTPRPNINPQGLSGLVAGPAEQALGSGLSSTAESGIVPTLINSQVQSPIPSLQQLKDFPEANTSAALDTIVDDPHSMQLLENDPDIDPKTIDQLKQSRNATQYEKNKALGQLKIETRDKGYFPPPPMQGIHSFIEVPNTTYQGQKVLGTITDQAEGGIYLDAVNQIPDIEKRAKLKSAFNSQGKYVLEIPNSLKPIPKPEKKVVKAEPVMKEEAQDSGTKSVVDLNSGRGNMERIVHDY